MSPFVLPVLLLHRFLSEEILQDREKTFLSQGEQSGKYLTETEAFLRSFLSLFLSALSWNDGEFFLSFLFEKTSLFVLVSDPRVFFSYEKRRTVNGGKVQRRERKRERKSLRREERERIRTLERDVDSAWSAKKEREETQRCSLQDRRRRHVVQNISRKKTREEVCAKEG